MKSISTKKTKLSTTGLLLSVVRVYNRLVILYLDLRCRRYSTDTDTNKHQCSFGDSEVQHFVMNVKKPSSAGERDALVSNYQPLTENSFLPPRSIHWCFILIHTVMGELPFFFFFFLGKMIWSIKFWLFHSFMEKIWIFSCEFFSMKLPL